MLYPENSRSLIGKLSSTTSTMYSTQQQQQQPQQQHQQLLSSASVPNKTTFTLKVNASDTGSAIVKKRKLQKQQKYKTQPQKDFTTVFLNAMSEEEMLCAIMEEEERICAKSRSCSGAPVGLPYAQDLKFIHFGIQFFGVDILKPTNLELLWKHRYALTGPFGCGKSTLLSVIANREILIPKHVDIYHLAKEAVPCCDKSVMLCVTDVDFVRNWLMLQNMQLSMKGDKLSQMQLLDIYDRLDDLAVNRAKLKAARILRGLGFLTTMQNKPAKDFSRKWRMRIALARALFVKPHLLLLDDPTHYLDLEACTWLERELKDYKRILLMVTNSEDLMSSVATNFLHLNNQELREFSCPYEQFAKQLQWEHYQKVFFNQDPTDICDLPLPNVDVMASLKHVVDERCFNFPCCGAIPSPLLSVVNVSFRYDDNSSYIFKNFDVTIDMDSRIALVGNCGKSTMLKLFNSELYPTFGVVYRNVALRIARYHQNLHEMLDLDVSAFNYLLRHFPNITDKSEVCRHYERYGLKTEVQCCPMRLLSECQRCRALFGFLTWQNPHLLLLDEPTTYMDIATINSFCDALNNFDGAFVLVTNNHRLIANVATEIWVCENEKAAQWDGDIFQYRKFITNKIDNDIKRTCVKMPMTNLTPKKYVKINSKKKFF